MRLPLWITAVLAALAAAGCTGEPAAPAAESSTEPVASAPVFGPIPSLTGRIPPAADGSSTVIILDPQTPTEFAQPEEPGVMDQFSMMFVPGVLVTRVDQPVRFTNSDQELHNVRVVHNESRDTVFNVGTPVGGYYEHTFDQPGVYAVMCDVHTVMGASIFVTTTPFVAVTDREGSFTFSDVLPGSYRASVHADGKLTEQVIEIEPGQHELVIDGIG